MNVRRMLGALTAAGLAVLAAASVAAAKTTAIVPAPAFQASDLNAFSADNWLTTGGGLLDNRYSTLTQVDKTTVSNLKQAWDTQFDLTGKAAAVAEEGSPVAYNGTLFVPDGASEVYAIDGASGQHLWSYKPVLTAAPLLAAVRGVAIGDGRIYEGQEDGNVVALDQTTGGVVWKSKIGDPADGISFSAAPIYYNGMVILGATGGDWGGRAYAVAIDAKTGLELWRHYIVPGPGELGTGSWGVTDWIRGGGALWIYPSVDTTAGLVYLVTGNPIPWNGRGPGNNLWTNSILALHVQNGQFAWGFQTVHHDIWDYDVTNPPVIFDATYNGVLRHGIAVASKTGWVYILDRLTGAPLVGIVEKKVPQIKDKAGAAYANVSKTQPFPVGDAFVSQCTNPKNWPAKAPDGKPYTAGCIFTPYAVQPSGSFIAESPGYEGGVDWPPSAFNPQLNYMYVCARDGAGATIGAIPNAQKTIVPGQLSLGAAFGPASTVLPDFGRIVAMNVLTNKIVWNDKLPKPCFSGMMTTATGLVFAGNQGTNTLDAYDAATGASLWASAKLPGTPNAPVMTYTAGGKQYLAILAQNHIVAFSL